jgi:hypothetical protein
MRRRPPRAVSPRWRGHPAPGQAPCRSAPVPTGTPVRGRPRSLPGPPGDGCHPLLPTSSARPAQRDVHHAESSRASHLCTCTSPLRERGSPSNQEVPRSERTSPIARRSLPSRVDHRGEGPDLGTCESGADLARAGLPCPRGVSGRSGAAVSGGPPAPPPPPGTLKAGALSGQASTRLPLCLRHFGLLPPLPHLRPSPPPLSFLPHLGRPSCRAR